MDLGELGLDENLKSMSKTPEEPIFDYDTIHGLTRGPQGADRKAGHGGHTVGRVTRRTHKAVLLAGGIILPPDPLFKSRSIGAVAAPTVGILGSLRLKATETLNCRSYFYRGACYRR